MFGKKKQLYKIKYRKIKYRMYTYHETIVSAHNPTHALTKLKKEYCSHIDIISIEEI